MLLCYLAFARAPAWLELKKASSIQMIFFCSQGHILSLQIPWYPGDGSPAKNDIQAQS